MDTGTSYKLFDQYAHTKNHHKAFEEILDSFIVPFRMYETVEAKMQAIAAVQQNPAAQVIAKFLDEAGRLAEGFNDPLGQLYMDKITKGHNGQYFTPSHVCDFMAAITVSEMKDGQILLDPACGSGRMLLAAAKINRHILFYGADIDATCVKMTVANMLLNSLSGEIAHMNSLSNVFFRGYRLDTKLFDGFHYPRVYEFTNPEQSSIWINQSARREKAKEFKEVVVPGGMQQGSLF